jgi:hypothetical protein
VMDSYIGGPLIETTGWGKLLMRDSTVVAMMAKTWRSCVAFQRSIA